MNRKMSLMAVTSVWVMTGCSISDNDHKFTDGPLTMRLTGIIVEDSSTSPSHYHLASLKEIATQTGDALADLSERSWNTSRQILKVEIKQTVRGRDYDYVAVIAPRSAGETAKWRVVSADRGVDVTSGSVLMWGFGPRAYSYWVAAGSYGSTLALEIVDDTKHKLYFLHGTTSDGTCLPSADAARKTFNFSDSNQVFTFPMDCTDSPVSQDIGSSDPPTLARLKEIAAVAGWSEGM